MSFASCRESYTHDDLKVSIQIHHPDRPLNYGERNLRVAVEPTRPASPPVCLDTHGPGVIYDV
jgi:hypothetical protein